VICGTIGVVIGLLNAIAGVVLQFGNFGGKW
jgi:hypothetical protein